jgi:hypothetical protein
MNPLQVPQKGPYGAAHIQGLFYISLKFLIKISLYKEIFPFSQRPQVRSVPQKQGTYGNRHPFLVPYLAYLLESPVKSPPSRFPSWRKMPNP